MTTSSALRPADDFGPVLTGRGLARMIRERAEEQLAAHGSVALDFEGVESMSPSFADELFAKMSVRPGDERVSFEHLNDDLAALVRFVIQGRPDPSG